MQPEQGRVPDDYRDPTAERQERDAYLLLLHLFNVTGGDPEVEIGDLRLARDLAFEKPQITLLLDQLLISGYVRRTGGGGVLITSEGAQYIQSLARNRRSVRHPSWPRRGADFGRWQRYRSEDERTS